MSPPRPKRPKKKPRLTKRRNKIKGLKITEGKSTKVRSPKRAKLKVRRKVRRLKKDRRERETMGLSMS